ncbi:MAG TPA: CXXX repeat peptide maturase [Candidatus Acidoferrales bacterium]|nr:CXXX repeat peptide maturase [Candidatus Acidoferrales bacterium]
MRFLILPVDKSSISFCFYTNPNLSSSPEPIPKATVQTTIDFARSNGLTVQFVYGKSAPPPQHRSIIESVNHVKIVPLALAKKYPEGIVVIESDEIDHAADFGLDAGRNVIVRLPIESIARLEDILFGLSGVFQRLNLRIVGMERTTEADLNLYDQQLLNIADRVSDYYRHGKIFELNFLSDRLILNKMKNCEAGIEHLTVGSDGRLYLCAGFLYDNPEDSVGSLGKGIHIPNSELLRLDHAPICKQCDAYQCLRCIYLNKKLTYEVNTPSNQQCVASHKERTATGKLLGILRDIPAFATVNDVSSIDYEDPLAVLHRFKEPHAGTIYPNPIPIKMNEGLQSEFVVIEETDRTFTPMKTGFAEMSVLEVLKMVLDTQKEILGILKKGAEPLMVTNKNNGNSNLEPEPNSTGTPTKKIVGKVTPAERDEIRALFERKNGLTELFKSLSNLSKTALDESSLYERIVADMGDVSVRYQNWWDGMRKNYSWENRPGYRWEINFESCEIYLEKE